VAEQSFGLSEEQERSIAAARTEEELRAALDALSVDDLRKFVQALDLPEEP
jgi:hypothetical protein